MNLLLTHESNLAPDYDAKSVEASSLKKTPKTEMFHIIVAVLFHFTVYFFLN